MKNHFDAEQLQGDLHGWEAGGGEWICMVLLYHLKKAETTLGSLVPDRNPWGLRPSSRKITSGVLRLAVNVGLRTYFREMSLIFATCLWGKK